MSEPSKPPPIRKGRKGPRASGPRSNTGCRTCKQRHVKCDETRPDCWQCRRTGRLCDGVGEPNSIGSVKSRTFENSVPSLLYTKLLGLSSSTTLTDRWPGQAVTGTELRSFAYFHRETSRQIGSAFRSASNVHNLVLQVSHSDNSIRHMVTALGSLAQHLQNVKLGRKVTLADPGYLRHADAEYLTSISRLRKEMAAPTQPAPELVLTSCFLLCIFDFLRGEDKGAMVHVSAAIDILKRCFTSQITALQGQSEQQQSNALITDFALVFSVIDLHGSIWLGRPSFHAPPMALGPSMDAMKDFRLKDDPSLPEISDYLNCQLVRAHCFHHINSFAYDLDHGSDAKLSILATKDAFLEELGRWPIILGQWIACSPALTELQMDCIALMRMNFHSLYVTLSSFFTASSFESTSLAATTVNGSIPLTLLSHHQTAHISAILEDARYVLNREIQDASACKSGSSETPVSDIASSSSSSQEAEYRRVKRDQRLLQAIALNCNEEDEWNMRLFEFATGAIQPLYLVASRAPEESVRAEALALLETDPWNEGAWDSGVMAKVARKCFAD